MLEVALLFVACFLITIVLFEFGRWLWVYCAMGSAARQGASYATAHGVDNESPKPTGARSRKWPGRRSMCRA